MTITVKPKVNGDMNMNLESKYIRIFFLLVSIAVLSAALIGMPSHAQKVEGPLYGGTLVALFEVDSVAHLVPSLTSSTCIQSSGGQIFNGLIRHDMDMNVQPELAKSWEISTDGLTYTFHLVNNATFHDGVPMTSADVKFTLENVTSKYHPQGSAVFQTLDHIETPDNYTVIIKLKAPFAPLLDCMVGYFTAILPKHLYEGTDILTNPYNLKPIGTGPFKFKEWVPGDHITLERNENYWKKGKPYLDKIVWKFVPDTTTRALSILYKVADLALCNLQTDYLEDIIEKPGIYAGHEYSKARPDVGQIALNLNSAPLNDVRVRRAMRHAVNASEMLDKALFGAGELIYSAFPKSYEWCYNPDVRKYEYDPALAEEMLDLAGYPRGPDGWRFGRKLIQVAYNNPYKLVISEILKERMAVIGIDVEIRMYDVATYVEKQFIQQDFDIGFPGAHGAGPDPSIGIARFVTTAGITKTPWSNSMSYSNPRVDQLFDLAATTVEKSKRADYFKEAQEIIAEDVPALYLFQVNRYSGWNTDFVGLPHGIWEGSTPMDEVWWIGGETSLEPPTPSSEPIPWETYIAIGIALSAIVVVVVVYIYRKR